VKEPRLTNTPEIYEAYDDKVAKAESLDDSNRLSLDSNRLFSFESRRRAQGSDSLT